MPESTTTALRSITTTVAMWVWSALMLLTGAAFGWAWAVAHLGAC